MGSFSYHVGQRIKKYRKSRGYTIEQFSAMINKSKATVSKYENGTITIDVETLYDVARALDIDLKCFIDYQPPVFHAQSVLPKNFYFNQPRAYMYYYDGRVRQLVRSLLCFSPSASGEGIDVMMYVGVDNFREPDRCQHLFTGEMKPMTPSPTWCSPTRSTRRRRCISACSTPCTTAPPPWACCPASAARRFSPPSP